MVRGNQRAGAGCAAAPCGPAFRALLGDRIEQAELAEAAHLAQRAARAASTAGRPLAAANADLRWPDEPHVQLWQAATVLREHRGDGHVAALLTAGLDPCEALVSFAAVGAAPVEVLASRGWTDQEWAAPWRTLGATDTRRLAQLTAPVMRTVLESGTLPRQSTLGMPRTPA